MPSRRNRLPVIAFSTSLSIHAMLLIALPLAIDAATPESDQPNPDKANEQAMMMPVELELGIDAPTPPSPTWIGFDEPKPQKAEPAEFEQAAFTEQPVAAAPPPSPPEAAARASSETAQPAESHSPPQPTEPSTPTKTEEVAAQPPVENVPQQPFETAPDPSVAPEVLIGKRPVGDNQLMEPKPRAVVQEPPDVEAVAEAVREVVEIVQKAIEEAIQPAPQNPRRAQESPAAEPAQLLTPPSPQQPAPQPVLPQPQQPPQPQIAPQAQDAPPETGTPSDKESPPTSIIDVPRDQWELGKPLARHGLLLKPRRPEFTLLTLITASPGNPLCQMNFDQQGIPVKCALLRSSGDKRVDDAVLASLYRWRAEGAELMKLSEGETLPVKIRIVLNKRALVSEGESPRTAKAE